MYVGEVLCLKSFNVLLIFDNIENKCIVYNKVRRVRCLDACCNIFKDRA